MGSLARAFNGGGRRSQTVAVVRESVNELLFQRLSAVGAGQSAALEVKKWLEEGNSVKRSEIVQLVKRLRDYKRFVHALQLLQWMDTRDDMPLSGGDHAVRIDLLTKTRGIDSAEKYFDRLPQGTEMWAPYGALLNCYCRQKMTHKAEAIYEKMKAQNCGLNTLAYNNLISLYLKTDQPQRVHPLIQEMKERNVKLNTFAYNLYMNSYAAMNDVEGAERVLEEMRKEGNVTGDWSTYSNLAAIYVKACLFEKADAALKEVEKLGRIKDRTAFHFLLSLYAGTGNADEVNRVWGALKVAFPATFNISYLVMLQSLVRLGDLAGARALFDEWASNCSNCNFKFSHILISVYIDHDMIDEAESILEQAERKAGRPSGKTMLKFMDYYSSKSQFDLALKYLDKALKLSKSDPYTKVNMKNLQPLLQYYEQNADTDRAEDLYRKLKKAKILEAGVYGSLLRTYIAADKIEPSMRRRIEADEFEVDSEMDKLLEKVCPSQ